MHFNEFQLDSKIQAGITACGYSQPTTVQEKTIPAALQGRDIMSLAQTGTGKSAAFVLPILQSLLQGRRGKVRSLVLSPTRELAEQTLEFFQALGKNTGLRGVSVYGGVSKFQQVKRLRSGMDIVVACPGRLLDILGDRALNLSSIETLVLDEADRMLDMGFMPDIRSILKLLPKQRQNMLFSATMPRDIHSLAAEVLNDPLQIEVDHEQPLQAIDQCLYPVQGKSKTKMLISLLQAKKEETTLVFTRTKHMATKLAKLLSASGLSAKDLQGNMSQNNRRHVLQGFKKGSFNVLVATDVASRGLDVSRIGHVINFDMPDTPEAYTHRIGRTGRAASSGLASTFVEAKDQGMIRAIERMQAKRIQRRSIPSLQTA
ncbi:MAG: DEAD/DEAH box helicase [Desulfohalobiaceae bacterium]